MSDDVLATLERLEDRVDEVRRIVTALQLASAEGRGDLKVVVQKLDTAANALANAAQSLQRTELQAATSGREDGKLPKWAIYAGGALILIIAALVGVKLSDLKFVLGGIAP